ncbi:MAG: hypothetical protein VR73_13950 [Gammaproteobacteria bacterium BRH_c0]|nr:MAG: hypothetical protein VR73_13950 [Gammaproteobacteria bacterium BRH_c0]
MTLNKLIQIAGIIDQKEAELLLASGVQWLGFPLRLPVNLPDLTEEAAAAIIRGLKPPACGVVITYLNQAEEIIAFCRELGASVVQLHGDIDLAELGYIKKHYPDLMIFKSLVVGLHTQQELLELVRCTAPYVDAYITDTYDPLSGATGATGKTHDWAVSRELVLCSPRPVILAGGLTADNVYPAILAVRPAGVDSHTGVEDESGRKSREKVERFVSEAQRAFRFIDNNP